MSQRGQDHPGALPRAATTLRAPALTVALALSTLPASASPAGRAVQGLGGSFWTLSDPIAAPSANPPLRLRTPGVRTPPSPPLLAPRLVLAHDWIWPDESPARFAQPIGLSTYTKPRLERPLSWQAFMQGRYGISSWSRSTSQSAAPAMLPAWAQPDLAWQAFQSPAFEQSVAAPAADHVLDLAGAGAESEAASDCKIAQVTIVRSDGERDRLPLVDCHGAVTADALDRISVMARPYRTARPPLPLASRPDETWARDGEWVPGVKLLHPRLVWVLNQIARRFPRRVVHIVSGYRRDSVPNRHTQGRALDLRILGVTNESLFAFCRTLPDVGCGYYPNSTFVHVDVRPLQARHAIWVDVSGPGERAAYVYSWPGVF